MTRTYGALAFAGDCWVLGGVEPHVCIRLKQLFPRIPKSAAPPYRFRDSPENAADLAWVADRYPLGATREDLKRLEHGRRQFEAMQTAMNGILTGDYQPPERMGLREGQVLRGYQGQACDLLAASGGLLLGDDVGLGKTFTACGAMLAPAALPAVVVCHAHLQAQWASVIERFTTLTAHSIRGTRPYPLAGADVRVFRYSQLLGWADMFEAIGVGLVAFDEVQELRRGAESGKGLAAHRLARAATLRLGLSATPIYNYGSEIFRILEYIRPGMLGDGGDFFREWCPHGHISDPKALGTYLREQHAFLRRTKHDVGQEMPAVNRIVDTIDYDEETVRSVDELAHRLAVRATTASFVERGQAARELDLLLRQKTGVAKARQVADFARIIVEGGEPIVLVGWHREVYDIWLTALADLKPAMYTGSESAAGKNGSAQRFLAGETDLLIMSLRSGAGLDGLQARCSTMVFGELDWSPGVHHQCIGRLDREGQAEPVTAIFLVVDEGSDPPMMEVLGLKASEQQSIIDPHLGVQTVVADVSRLHTLVQRYLDKRPRANAAA